MIKIQTNSAELLV